MTYSRIPLVDCHIHLSAPEHILNLTTICDSVGIDKANIVCLSGKRLGNQNPLGFQAKTRFPERFYVFGALDHSAIFSSGRIQTPSLAEQVDRLIAIGADGMKLLENKPTARKELGIPVDSEYFEGLFARLEETGFPVLWHVADPEEFWDPEKTPGWAKQRGWGYDDTFPPKEQLYSEVENVLERHPGLRVIFAHFYFLSADLQKAARMLDSYEGVSFDLAPGIELLYNMSKDPAVSHDFFVSYSDRIIFGTDIFASMDPKQAGYRSGLVRRWLETRDEFRVPDGADFLLGPPEDGLIRGLGLPADTLKKIYQTNFEQVAGPRPKTLNAGLAEEESKRVSDIILWEEQGVDQQ